MIRHHPRPLRPAAVPDGTTGAALVELAIVILPLCVILFGIISYGSALSFKQSMTQAANEAARAAATAPASDGSTLATDRARTAAERATSGFGKSCSSPGMSCTFTVGSCGTDTCMTVELAYDLENHPLLPRFPIVSAALPKTVVAKAVVQVNTESS